MGGKQGMVGDEIPPNMKEFSILMQIKLILTWTFFTHCLVLRAMSDDFWNLEITH